MNSEQVQVFTPTPGTYSAVMYYTEMAPKTRQKIFVEKDTARKEKQKQIVLQKDNFKSRFGSQSLLIWAICNIFFQSFSIRH